MTTLSVATRKLTIAPVKESTATPVYQNLFQGLDEDRVYFEMNPKGFNLERAKKNPKFKGTKGNIRQGDVILAVIQDLPEGLEPANTTVLAESVFTSNTHEFIYGDVTVYGHPETKEFYVSVKGDFAILAHNESQAGKKAHGCHVVQPGNYHLKFQQTYVDNKPVRVID